MRYEFAPMEGITGYLYRNAHHAFFPSMDCYYTPFITPKPGKSFTTREWNDVAAEHNTGIEVIPQILTNQADGFCMVAEKLKEQGYREVNLNLGCPSGTVTAKKKGSGFLAYPDELDRFLDGIFEGCSLEISVKTRIGADDPEEFEDLLRIFNRYPIKRLIVHPRIQKDFYKNTPRLDSFELAVRESKNPVCYNGDLFCREDVAELTERFPESDCLMLGRGMLIDPGLVGAVREGKRTETEQIRRFYERLVQDYSQVMSGERDVLFKMKELWFWQGKLFENAEKYLKKIRKAQRLSEYQAAANALFESCPQKSGRITI